MQPENNHPTQLFKQVLSSPATLTDTHTDQLQTLLYSFPQCGVLRAIQARTSTPVYLTQAAAWFGTSELLEKVVKAPETLPAVTAAQIITTPRVKQKALQAQEVKPAQAPQTPVIEPEPAPQVTAQQVLATHEPQLLVFDQTDNEPDAEPVHQPENIVSKPDPEFVAPIFKQEPLDETQKLIIENLAANDYFVFDKAFADRNQMWPEAAKPEVPAEPVRPSMPPAKSAEEGSVTRYHDDKMPYSFLWWLDKTRSKHSQMYQPFAKPAAPKNETLHTGPNAEDRSKEEEIVERFIQEEPQMRPPSGDKLDNENKAKLSVEDQEELITETLARIYADQMLYSKAIAAYKILILKNPEKRRYFASQIEILEKKIN